MICPLNRGCPLFRESVIRGFNIVSEIQCLMSAIEGEYCMCYVCMKVFVWSSVHVVLQEAERKNGVGMALDVATLPLILYRKVYNH